MSTLKLANLLLLIALTTTFNTEGKDKKGKRDSEDEGNRIASNDSKRECAISSHEKQVIHEYIEHSHAVSPRGKKAHNLPPGLAKKVAPRPDLPTGWETRIQKGEIISEPVLKECRPLPPEITIKLPPPPGGTIMVAVEGKVVRLMEKTREILDVFDLLR